MSNSLRDQLLGLGFEAPAPPPKPERPARDAGASNSRGAKPRHDAGRPRTDTGRPRTETGRPRSDTGRPHAGAGQPGVDAGRQRADAGKPRHGPERRNSGASGGPGAPGAPGASGAPGAPSAPSAPRRHHKPGERGPRKSQEEIDLAKAYALRAHTEKQERIAAEAAKQEEARLRREARARLTDFLKDRVLNDPAADIARHFPYGGKIKRIHVNADQLPALNRGELGVLQQDGRYLLVDKATLDAAEAIFAPALALRVDPDAPAGDDPYADPAYQVPDDLVW